MSLRADPAPLQALGPIPVFYRHSCRLILEQSDLVLFVDSATTSL